MSQDTLEKNRLQGKGAIMINRCIISVLALFSCLMFFNVSKSSAEKILWVDSYHAGYQWTDDIEKGIRSVIEKTDVEFELIRMDTKRKKSEEFKKKAALKAKALIETWKPDVVITSDDSAAKYLIVPYYRGKSLPFVFCGVNWDSSVYGFPAPNVTGMEEVALLPQTLDVLKKYSKGTKLGVMASDTLSERKNAYNMKKNFDIFFEERFATTLDKLKEKYLKLQNECDMIVLLELKSVSGFDHDKMITFVENNTNIPTGAMQSYLRHYAMITFSKIGKEQGEWAANTALEILAGKSPKEIPIVTNKKAKIYMNMRIAKRLGIKFPMELIERATFVRGFGNEK